MNRRDRRAVAKARRTALGRLKLRCIGCERVGRATTKEHLWPKWLAERAGLGSEGVRWFGGKRVGPAAATLPLCAECNNSFGALLEAPVSPIFEDVESGNGISDAEAELIIRWLWKFEGLAWNAQYFSNPDFRYSDLWTLKERVLGHSINSIRPKLALAVALIEKNDKEFKEWLVGIDSAIENHNAIFVSGVFCRTVLMVSLNDFFHLIPSQFQVHSLQPIPDPAAPKVFFPKIGFEWAADAVNVTATASVGLTAAHEAFARQRDRERRVIVGRRRIEIP